MPIVADEIRNDIGSLLDRLQNSGYRVKHSEYHEAIMGNWFVDLQGPRSFRLIRDRNQFMIDGDEADLRKADLRQAFDSSEKFMAAVLDWAVA